MNSKRTELPTTGTPVPHPNKDQDPSCSVRQCSRPAVYAVILADLYLQKVEDGQIKLFKHEGLFLEKDDTCAWMCERHAQENESQACGVPAAYQIVSYPYTNRNRARGFSWSVPLHEWLGRPLCYNEDGTLIVHPYDPNMGR
jgi:hypothetical protein